MYGKRTLRKQRQNYRVFNSTTLCDPHKYLVQKAIEFSKKDLTAKEIVKKLQKALESEASFLIPSDFEYLKRGGRLSPLAAKITGKLKLFPVLKKNDDGTTLNRYSIKRGFTHAVKSICEHLKENLLSKEAIIYISHGEDIELANKTKNIVSEFFSEQHSKYFIFKSCFHNSRRTVMCCNSSYK